ncbi:alpha/beta hydrolase family protein [Pseudomonas sp. MM211]|uniref:alpha/beta hydrolase family protein n=1 Tax=Pseudomonas sp. MM211 TaxID=2866808 RepID=UPI001CECF1CB|nr:alpha/beta hydrolase family protein [Pseudomonas sp. MM211]UCJ18264.1 alpha/beta hydrolase family protein [Pseudomonas sp. MM211]
MTRFRHSPRYVLCLALLAGSLSAQGEQSTPAEAGEKADAKPEQRAPLAERSDLEALALERQLAANEQQRLDAAGTQFLALWLPANDPAPKGAVVLLPGDDESADAPRVIGPLRQKLPDAGWHSLSLSLPDPQGANLPLRVAEPPAAAGEAPAEKSAEPATPEPTPAPATEPAQNAEAARAAHVERVFARIDAGIAFAAQQQAKTVVLLGHGSGAYWAARYIAERKPANVTHLLLVDIHQPEGFESPINDLLTQLKASVGDFYYRDSPTARQAALLRKQLSQRQKQPAFVQVGLDALPGNPAVGEEQLFRRLRGWLDKQAGGGK